VRVVTSFTCRCHDIGEHGTIIGGPVLYDFADTAEVMRWYRGLLPSLPEELSGGLGLITIPPAPPAPARYPSGPGTAGRRCTCDPDNFFHVNQNIQPAIQAGA
jgi:hypothetical protein